MDLENLKRLAQEATPGEWEAKYIDIGEFEVNQGSWVVAETSSWDAAAYIAAADPQTVLELIDEVERLRAERENHKKRFNAAFAYVASVHLMDADTAEQARAEIKNWVDELDAAFPVQTE